MSKRVTAHKAYSRAVELANKRQRVIFINECPDCGGTGKINNQDCGTCGNEPDDAEALQKVGGYWFRPPANS